MKRWHSQRRNKDHLRLSSRLRWKRLASADGGRMKNDRNDGCGGWFDDGKQFGDIGEVGVVNALEDCDVTRRYCQRPTRRLKENANTSVGVG